MLAWLRMIFSCTLWRRNLVAIWCTRCRLIPSFSATSAPDWDVCHTCTKSASRVWRSVDCQAFVTLELFACPQFGAGNAARVSPLALTEPCGIAADRTIARDDGPIAKALAGQIFGGPGHRSHLHRRQAQQQVACLRVAHCAPAEPLGGLVGPINLRAHNGVAILRVNT